MPTIEFVGQSASDSDARFAQTSRLVNYYREPVIGQGQAGHILKSVLGMNYTLADTGTVLVYAMHVMGGALFVVANDALYRVTATGGASFLGTVSVGADCTMSSNNGVLTVAGAGLYYTWDGTTLATPTAGAFESFGSVAFLGNYTLLTEKDGRRVQWSNLATPGTLDALNFATAEGTDADLIRGVEINGFYWLFKAASHEIWGLTGQGTTNAFQRVPGGVRDIGIRAYNLITKFDGGAFLVGDEGICYIVNGARLEPVSIPAVETAIAEETPANCFYYEDEGHKFCVVRFRNRPAWVYDISTREWHERAEGTSFGGWTATAAAYFAGGWQVGMENGQIRTLSRSNADGDTVLRRTAISRTLYLEGRLFSVSELEFRGGFGVAGLSRDAAAYIQISRDNGRTFTEPKTMGLGGTGDYAKRAIARRLGSTRQFTVAWNMTDPVEWPVLSTARVEVAA